MIADTADIETLIRVVQWSMESSLARSLFIALLAVILSPMVAGWVAHQRPSRRKLALVVAVAPFFSPELIVGYCYSSGVLALVERPLQNLALYTGLMLFKAVPVGMLTVLYSPAVPLSSSALHCYRLLPRDRRDWRSRVRILVFGRLSRCLPVFSLSFLVAYQEFETASLMSIPSWTVDLFDAQAKAIQPAGTLSLLLAPLIIVVVTVLPTIGILSRSGLTESGQLETPGSRSRWAGGLFVVLANLVLWGIPLFNVGESGLRNIDALAGNPVLVRGFARELVFALAFAFCAALATLFAAALLLRRLKSCEGAVRTALAVTLLLPGLAGALSVSLLLFVLIQQEPLLWLRSTPIPAVAGMTAFLLPRAVLMLLLFQVSRKKTSIGSAELLGGSRHPAQARKGFDLLWQLEDRALVWTFAAVFFWGFFNLTTASLLMPLAIVPLPAQLYNLMHYGRTMSLSAQTLVSVLVPVVLIALTSWLVPRLERMLSKRDEPNGMAGE